MKNFAIGCQINTPGEQAKLFSPFSSTKLLLNEIDNCDLGDPSVSKGLYMEHYTFTGLSLFSWENCLRLPRDWIANRLYIYPSWNLHGHWHNLMYLKVSGYVIFTIKKQLIACFFQNLFILCQIQKC